jgi:hypothetical protein
MIKTITDSEAHLQRVLSRPIHLPLFFNFLFLTSLVLFYFTHSLFEGTNLKNYYYLSIRI